MNRKTVVGVGALLAIAVVLQLLLTSHHSSGPNASSSPTPSPSGRASASGSPSTSPSGKPTASSRPTPTPTIAFTPTPPPATVVVSGVGTSRSRTFQLNDSLGYTARYTLGTPCVYNGTLTATDGSYTNTDFINDTGPTSGFRILTSPPMPSSDAYFVDMQTAAGCAWSITFTPR